MIELGILTPVLSLVPGSHSDWEPAAGIEEVRRIAETADRLGYSYLTCSEHVAIPVDGMDLPGPALLGPVADVRLPRCPHVTHPLGDLGARVAVPPSTRHREALRPRSTASAADGSSSVSVSATSSLSSGRSAYRSRIGARDRRPIRAMRPSFGRSHPSYDGEFFSFDGVVVDPCGLQQQVPLWVGGRTQRSLRRAVALGDGWCPFAVSPRRAAAWLAEVAETEAWHQREHPLEVILGTRRGSTRWVRPTKRPSASPRCATLAPPRRRSGSSITRSATISSRSKR